MTANDFNEKYKDYLEESYYGLNFEHKESIIFLDNVMKDLIKIPGFKYQQIKLKWGPLLLLCKRNKPRPKKRYRR